MFTIKQTAVVAKYAGRINEYYLLSGFNAKSVEDWQRLRLLASEIMPQAGLALMAAFMDLRQHYEPSPVGQDIGEPYLDYVIAQYVVTATGKQLFFPDPFGSGKYTEPTSMREDFSL